MSRRGAVLTTLVLLLGGTACRSGPPYPVDWKQKDHTLRDDYPETHRRLFLRDVTVHGVSAVGTAVALGQASTDPVLYREVVRRALEETGAFAEVVRVGADTVRPSSEAPGLVLDLAFKDAQLLHTGETAAAGKAFWLWFFTGLPGTTIRDQRYLIRYHLTARVTDAATESVVVPWEELGKPVSEEYALNFNERVTGFGSYAKLWIFSPASIAVDEHEILRGILPPSLQAPVRSLFSVLNQVTFPRTRRLEIAKLPSEGVLLTEVLGPVGEFAGDAVDLSVTIVIEQGVKALNAVHVGGHSTLDFSEEEAPPLEMKKTLALKGIPVRVGQPVSVSVALKGEKTVRKILELRAVDTGIRPIRSKEGS